MRAKHWLIGCALCIGGISGAAATSADTQDMDASSRAVTDGGSTRDSNSGGGDVLGLLRDGTAHNSSSNDNSGNTSSRDSDRSGGASSAPARTRQPQLGWQSLLPGSIQ